MTERPAAADYIELRTRSAFSFLCRRIVAGGSDRACRGARLLRRSRSVTVTASTARRAFIRRRSAPACARWWDAS